MLSHWDRDRLILSIVVIVLCLGAVLGITYLLSSHWEPGGGGTGGEGGGESGTVTPSKEIRIDILDGDQESLVGHKLEFVGADGTFGVYFEPGVAYCTEGFRLKNVGTVPIEFGVNINDYSESLNREQFYEIFELYLTTDPTNLDDAQRLMSYEGHLAIDQSSETFYIAVKMKQTAGNEFQNQSYSGISVTVHAVQSNVTAE